MQNKEKMLVNRETAMRLWKSRYGKENRVKDFAGREMDKSAYDDRGSKFGWNIDHVLPQSRGGKTNDSNLVCCHIATNDEKAASFPCFSANGKMFEIRRVENHYEISPKSEGDTAAVGKSGELDLFNAKDVVRRFKELYENKNPRFVGTVTVRLWSVKNVAVLDFIAEIFKDKNVHFKKESGAVKVVIRDNNMPKKEQIEGLLKSCMLLNTYLNYYFEPQHFIDGYVIFYGVHTKEDKIKCLCADNDYKDYGDSPMYINALVKINTTAEENIKDASEVGTDSMSYSVYEYNYIYYGTRDTLKEITNKK